MRGRADCGLIERVAVGEEQQCLQLDKDITVVLNFWTAGLIVAARERSKLQRSTASVGRPWHSLPTILSSGRNPFALIHLQPTRIALKRS